MLKKDPGVSTCFLYLGLRLAPILEPPVLGGIGALYAKPLISPGFESLPFRLLNKKLTINPLPLSIYQATPPSVRSSRVVPSRLVDLPGPPQSMLALVP